MHEPVERLELAVRRYVERDDDAVDGPRAEAGAYEMADPDIEARWNAIREGACGSAQTGEDRDLGGAGHNS
jgi:hypothetical protein